MVRWTIMNKLVGLVSVLLLSTPVQANENVTFCKTIAERTPDFYTMWRADMNRAEIQRVFSRQLRGHPDKQEIMRIIIDGTYLAYHRGIDAVTATEVIWTGCEKL